MEQSVRQIWSMAHAGQAVAHTHAIGLALLKQHQRPRAMMLSLLRACTPMGFMALLAWARRTFKDKKMKEREMMVHDLEAQFVDYIFTFTALASVMLGLSFYVGRLAVEKESGLRHLTHVSGLSRVAFWGAMTTIEGFLQGFFEAILLTVIGGVVVQIRMVQNTSPILLMLSLGLIVCSSVLLGTMIHMIFRAQRTANIVATVLAVALTFLASVWSGTHALIPTQRVPVWIMLIPLMHSFQSLYALSEACTDSMGNACLTLKNVNDGPYFSPFEVVFGTSQDRADAATIGASFMSIIGTVLLQHAILWPIVLLTDMLHFHPLKQRRGTYAQDSVSTGSGPHGVVLDVNSLVHWYSWWFLPQSLSVYSTVPANDPDKVLNGVSFTIQRGAMLGLLGPNGAGKTTTIRCITGEELPRSGSVTLCPSSGFASARVVSRGADDVSSSVPLQADDVLDKAEAGGLLGNSVHRSGEAYLGLCPQDSALNPDLTVEEHLLFFARIRGGPKPEAMATRILQSIKLDSRRDSVPIELSGGMRRRLAIGCSMVGHPAVALLDEPTTGLDPVARREIWSAIMESRDAGTACLLTTHMLEEAEELCTNIVILTKGHVAAEGSVQQLKENWSTGYMLHVDARAGEEQKVRDYMSTALPEPFKQPIKTSLHGQMIYNVGRDATFVGNLFLRLAKEANDNAIRHWGISQASLEDAYLRIIGQAT
eukprot:TRINITY_DN91037_c0_g1_i1.p1 TRINITY_DN91037_c0_g1~~TRINITY_DN91037_c0_g1_i1.p1  ORF type:complete len:735 (+),score=142.89 TRINITY_DN91037_c0_g1_i1:81-2207(+)